jgi:transcriptional regulator with PAS, ATPase and Fis domain
VSEEGTVTKGLLYTDGDTGALKVRRYVLNVVAGPNAGIAHDLESGTVMIGSHENNDIVLTDPTVSRYHLEVQVRAEGIRITDLDSTNGTYLGETRLGSVMVRGRARLLVGGETRIEIAPADEQVKVEPFRTNFFGKCFGASKAMVEMFALLNQVAPTDTTVLIQGETGTGKELLAEAMHAASRRRDGRFVVVDCGAIPRELMGSELFGHAKGAFTGATYTKRGLADEAHRGTLFLDEVGELALELQPQLLRILEKREVRPIGETKPHRVDVRVMAATNKDLKSLVKAGKFREDLFFRLAVVNVGVPPLRKRKEDIPALARLFLAEMDKGDFEIPDAIIDQLMEHDWPGNVRELRNVVERGLSLATAEITPDTDPDMGGPDLVDGKMPAEMMDMPFKEAKGMLVEAFEREYLTQLLSRHKGNISRAAQEAGIDRNYIHRLVKKYNIPVERA